ncbi:hypothetical protein ABNF97_26875 [Plantactinospora sp. B6F1]|uniref:hypothetical protein n=1 Tax=Plantactinospora sp. B6F1 TaxID=3158971 RepID=UPI0032D98A87
MSTALLALAYYFIVTPVGLLSRIVHDPLRRGWNRRASTYMHYLANRSPRTDHGASAQKGV